MKYSECNTRQKKAFRNIYYCANQIIGGWENTMSDYPKDSEEYKEAESILNDHEGLVDLIYHEITTSLYEEGSCMWGGNIESYLKDIRFCGKSWLLERIEARVKKMGY